MTEEFASESLSVTGRLANRRARSFARIFSLPIVLLAALSGAIVVDRLAAPHVSANVDPAFYAVASHELLLGKSLYTDVWDHKPPAPFVAYAAAELAFGYSTEMLVILNIIVSLVILFGIFYAAKAGEGGNVAAIVAATLFVITSGNFHLESRDPNTEPFINACVVWAFGIFANDRGSGLTVWRSLLIGVLFLIGSMFKPVVVAVAALLAAAYFVSSAVKKRAFRDVAIIAGVGALGWVAVFAYFAATGRFSLFYDSMIAYNQFYSGDLISNLVAPIHGGEFLVNFMVPLALLSVVGVVIIFAQNRRSGSLIGAYLISSWIAIALPGRFSVHYFQLWLPPLLVATGWTIGYFANSRSKRIRVGAFVVAGILGVGLLLNETIQYENVAARQWSPVLSNLKDADDVTAKINGLLKDDETFFLWGNTPNLYLLTNRRPPAAIMFDAHLRVNPLYERLSQRVASDLARTRPELLVTETGRPPVPDWISKDYEPVPIFSDTRFYSIFARRDGRIASGK